MWIWKGKHKRVHFLRISNDLRAVMRPTIHCQGLQRRVTIGILTTFVFLFFWYYCFYKIYLKSAKLKS